METKKSSFQRLIELDECFRSDKKYSITELMRITGKSRRQIYLDIEYIKEKAGEGILTSETINGKAYYSYSTTGFSILKDNRLTDLAKDEIDNLIDLIGHFAGLPQFEWMSEILLRIKHVSKSKNKRKQQPFISFDNNPDVKGIEQLQSLMNYIRRKQVLKIKYQSFKKNKPELIVLHPYHLKQYNNRWFLFGLNEEYKIPTWNLPLDRITNIGILKKKYEENTSINWDNFFDDAIGVSKNSDAKAEEIILHFNSFRANYVISKLLHSSQKLPKVIDGNTTEIRIKVVVNNELIALLLSFGEDVKVVSPVHLSKTIQKKLQTAIGNY